MKKFIVSYHRWAWSRRTEGMPIFSVTPEGVIQIGETRKNATVYQTPSDTILIARVYFSNSGKTEIYFYQLTEGEELPTPKLVAKALEVEKFTTNPKKELTEKEKEAINKFIKYFLQNFL